MTTDATGGSEAVWNPLRCPACGTEAYLCDRPRHGTATWAFHCKSRPYHNRFGRKGDGGPPPEWTDGGEG